ncbi:MAG TPA: LPXTG cell wall anchor domain-containing protein [Bacillales bacterium]
MRLRRIICTLLAIFILAPAWFLPANQSHAETKNAITFKIPVPESYVGDPMYYVPTKYKINGSYVLGAMIKQNTENGKYQYKGTNIEVSFESQNGNLLITVPSLDWSKSEVFSVLITTRDFIFPYKITKEDLGKTIVVNDNETYVPFSMSIPFAGEGFSKKTKLCFEDKNGISMDCVRRVKEGIKIPKGNYDIFVEASDNQASYGLFKLDVPLTSADSTVRFTQDSLVDVTATMKDSENKLTLTNINPMGTVFGDYLYIPVKGEKIYLSPISYDQLIYEYETKDGWSYKYSVKINGDLKDADFVFDSNLAFSITDTDLLDKYQMGLTYVWYDNFHVTDGLGNPVVDVSDPPGIPLQKIGLGHYENVETGKAYDRSFRYSPPFFFLATPETKGDYLLTIDIPDSPIEIDSAATPITVGETAVVVKPDLEDGKAVIKTSDLKKLSKNQTFKVEISEKDADDATIHFSAEQIQLLQEKNSFIVIKGEKGGFTLPSTLLSGNKDVNLQINRLDPVEGSISSVIDFNIQQGNQELHQFDQPVTLSFKVDPSKVEDPSKLMVFYFNTEDHIWEKAGGTYEDGYVTVTTKHFSTYAVFSTDNKTKGIPDYQGTDSQEAPSQQEPDAKGSPDQQETDTQGDSGQQVTDPQEDSNQQETETSAGSGEQETNTQGDSNQQETDLEDASGSQETETGGHKLPETATNTYNWLLFGGVLVVLGAAILVFRRKKQRS